MHVFQKLLRHSVGRPVKDLDGFLGAEHFFLSVCRFGYSVRVDEQRSALLKRELILLVLALWDFRYSWEIYTPAAKRKYGYYTLPILFGEKFVGRIEAVPDRKENILRVRGLWWEDGIRPTKKPDTALMRTLRGFAGFNDCKDVKIES